MRRLPKYKVLLVTCDFLVVWLAISAALQMPGVSTIDRETWFMYIVSPEFYFFSVYSVLLVCIFYYHRLYTQGGPPYSSRNDSQTSAWFSAYFTWIERTLNRRVLVGSNFTEGVVTVVTAKSPRMSILYLLTNNLVCMILLSPICTQITVSTIHSVQLYRN